MNPKRPIATLVVFFCSALLGACGGGGSSSPAPSTSSSTSGSGGGSTGGSGSSGSGTATLVVPKNTTINASTTQGPEVLTGTVTVRGGSEGSVFYYTISYQGTAIGYMTDGGNILSQQTGTTAPSGPAAGRITGEPDLGEGGIIKASDGPNTQIQVNMLLPAELGAGTYTDTITIAACYDSACAHPVAGSPQQVLVTYVITGNAIPDTTFDLRAPATLILEAPTSGTTAPSGTAVIATDNLPPYGAYVFATISTGAAIASTAFQSNLNGTGTLTVTAKPPATLGSGIYADAVHLRFCFDAACTKPAAVTFTIPVSYVVDASPGIDFTQQTIPGQISSMVWSPINQRIYATVPGYAATNPGSLLIINPTTASIETVLSLGSESNPVSLDVSDDGQYAYVVDSVGQLVDLINLSTLSIQTVPVGGATTVWAVPGVSGSFLVESTDLLTIFDGTIQRPQTFTGPSETYLNVAWGANDTVVYVYENTVISPTMVQLAASSTGLSVAQQTSDVVLSQGPLDGFLFATGLLYTSAGTIFNPTTSATQSPFVLQNSNPEGTSVSGLSLAIDTSLNRAYFLTTDGPQGNATGVRSVEGFNLTTQQPTWITRFPGGAGPVIRWGTNGLAFTTSSLPNYTVVLIQGSVVAR